MNRNNTAPRANLSPQSDLTALLVLGCVLLVAVGAQATSRMQHGPAQEPGGFHRSAMRLSEAPRTALGSLALSEVRSEWPERSDRVGRHGGPSWMERAIRAAVARSIGLMNAWTWAWPIFFLLSAAVLVILKRIALRTMAWPTPLASSGLLLYMCIVNAGLAATIPDFGGSIGRGMGLGFAGIQVVASLLALLFYLSLAFPSKRRTLKYGPPFVLPTKFSGETARKGDGVLIGRVDRDILPEHTAWHARASGDVVVPFDRISCGITILGEKGSGKSRLLYRFHDAIREKYSDRPMLIHDPKGEWYRTFYDKDKDLIFAPHFVGSVHWDIWNDFHRVPELCHELISTAVYAHDAKADTFWMDSAIKLLRSVTHFETLHEARLELGRLRKKNAVDKTWLSIYQVAQLGLEDIIKVQLLPGWTRTREFASLSIDQALQHKGRIFLLNDPSCATEQKGAFSLFLSAFLLRALSRPDLPAGKLQAVAIVDEALTFNLPPDVDRRIYAMCRSKGLSVIAGAQRLPARQLHERGEWSTAEFLFGMKVISQETQSSLARRAGQMHFDQSRRGRSRTDDRVTLSENDQGETIDAIPPEHFGRLSPRKYILFHDRGLVTGTTGAVDHEQRELAMPDYDPRHDVMAFSQSLGEQPPIGKDDKSLVRPSSTTGKHE